MGKTGEKLVSVDLFGSEQGFNGGRIAGMCDAFFDAFESCLLVSPTSSTGAHYYVDAKITDVALLAEMRGWVNGYFAAGGI